MSSRRPLPRRAALTLAPALAAGVALLASACGTLGGGDGGADELPQRGIKPWARVEPPDPEDPEATLPFVLAPPDPGAERWVEPSAAALDGGRLGLWWEARPSDGGPSRLLRAESADGGLTWSAPAPALEAEDAPAWTGGRLAAPAVLRAGAEWVLAVGYGDGEGIALARGASPDALAFDGEPALVADPGDGEGGGVRAPAAAFDGTRLELYYEAREEAGGSPRIRRAVQAPDGRFVRAGDALAAGEGCAAPGGDPEPCWDEGGVGSPEVRVALTGAGRPVYRMVYTGLSGTRGHPGFAASWDGVAWSRYRFNPLLDDDVDQRAPTNLRLGGRWLLVWAESRGAARHGLALGVNDDGRAADRLR